MVDAVSRNCSPPLPKSVSKYSVSATNLKMRYTTSLVTTLLALFTSFSIVSAIQSKPFYLVIQSDDSSLQGHALDACHEGAAIEGLCKASELPIPKADKPYQTFRFNYTRSDPNDGLLVWELISNIDGLFSSHTLCSIIQLTVCH